MYLHSLLFDTVIVNTPDYIPFVIDASRIFQLFYYAAAALSPFLGMAWYPCCCGGEPCNICSNQINFDVEVTFDSVANIPGPPPNACPDCTNWNGATYSLTWDGVGGGAPSVCTWSLLYGGAGFPCEFDGTPGSDVEFLSITHQVNYFPPTVTPLYAGELSASVIVGATNAGAGSSPCPNNQIDAHFKNVSPVVKPTWSDCPGDYDADVAYFTSAYDLGCTAGCDWTAATCTLVEVPW